MVETFDNGSPDITLQKIGNNSENNNQKIDITDEDFQNLEISDKDKETLTKLQDIMANYKNLDTAQKGAIDQITVHIQAARKKWSSDILKNMRDGQTIEKTQDVVLLTEKEAEDKANEILKNTTPQQLETLRTNILQLIQYDPETFGDILNNIQNDIEKAVNKVWESIPITKRDEYIKARNTQSE